MHCVECSSSTCSRIVAMCPLHSQRGVLFPKVSRESSSLKGFRKENVSVSWRERHPTFSLRALSLQSLNCQGVRECFLELSSVPCSNQRGIFPVGLAGFMATALITGRTCGCNHWYLFFLHPIFFSAVPSNMRTDDLLE